MRKFYFYIITYNSMKQIYLLFITLFVLIARLNAQTLVGDWDVEALSLRGWVGGDAGILEDEDCKIFPLTLFTRTMISWL